MDACLGCALPGSFRNSDFPYQARHCAALRGLCQRLGNSYTRLATNQPLELALFDFLRARMQRGKAVKRVNRIA